MAKLPTQLLQASEQVHQTGKPKMVKVRDLLSWFGAQRRGVLVASEIRKALKRAKVVTVPDFEVAYIDQRIKLKAFELPTNDSPVPRTIIFEGAGIVTESPYTEVTVVGGSVADPAPRIGMIEAAHRKPVSVKLDTSVIDAVTLMALHDFSQLPVMQGERTVNGLISWRSLGRSRIKEGKACAVVRECMENVEILNVDAHLFEAVSVIAKKDVVLIKDSDNKISGLVTNSDISVKFGALAEPFLMLSEIENHLRRLIDGKFSLAELTAARNPNDSGRKIETVANLTFGEYIRLLDTETNWQKLNYNLSRVECIRRLREVGRIRNDVMHFHPDGISPEDLELLRETRKFFQAL